jgi:acyl phosphate:glycerol-3-phosphate acyltransferase
MPYAVSLTEASSYLAGALAAYLIGGIPFGLWVCRRWSGHDPRKYGSGNIGATNVYRLLGPWGFLIVLMLDAGKGATAVVAGQAIGVSPNPWMALACAVCAIVGANWSVYLGFRGGKGVGVSLGAGAAVMPVVACLALVTWAVMVALTRYVSLSSIVAATLTPVFIILRGEHPAFLMIGVSIALFVLIRHRSNVRRLLAGVEPKFGVRINPAAKEDEMT